MVTKIQYSMACLEACNRQCYVSLHGLLQPDIISFYGTVSLDKKVNKHPQAISTLHIRIGNYKETQIPRPPITRR